MPGVGLLVGLEVVSEGEGEAARLAPEGLLPGVDQLVPLQLGILLEDARAPGVVTSVATAVVSLQPWGIFR